MRSTLLLPCLVPALYGLLVTSYPTALSDGQDDLHIQSFQPYGRGQKDLPGKGFAARLRDGAIQLVWGRPPTSTRQSQRRHGKPSATAQVADSQSLLIRYGADVVLRFNISSAAEAAALADAANILFLDVWEHTTDWADIRLAKDVVPSLLGLLPSSLQHAHTPLMHDLSMCIYESSPSAASKESPQQLPDTHHSFSPNFRTSLSPSPEQTNIFFQDYQPLSVIHPWMRLMQSLFPTHVQLVNIGTSFEGRDILALRVGVHPTNSQEPIARRKTVIISAGAHAREWISTASVTYAAYSLITSYGKSPPLTRLVEQFDWVFIPTMNPDGYVYTWDTDRLWRKNRQTTSLRFCKGIDVDRAYSFQWDGEASKGNPCSESFAGDGPFEAVEAHRFASWVKNETENNGVDIVGFLDFHSYSQQVLYPFSYSCVATPPTLENLEELGLGLAKAIRQADDRAYDVTSACEGSVATNSNNGRRSSWPRIESGGGSTLDWMYHEAGVKYAFQIKLRDKGGYGFLLPSKNIVPSGKEVFNAVLFFGRYLASNKGIEMDGLETTMTQSEMVAEVQRDESEGDPTADKAKEQGNEQDEPSALLFGGLEDDEMRGDGEEL